MPYWRFWVETVVRALRPSPSAASTWATYVGAVVVLVCLGLGIEGARVNWFSALVPFGLAAVLFLVGLFRGAYAIYREEHLKVLKLQADVAELRNRLAAQGPEPQKEAAVRAQLAALTRAEVLVIKHLVACGRLTQEQITDFCQRNGLGVVNAEAFRGRGVTFLTRDLVEAAWHVIPGMESAVHKALSEIAS